MASQQNAYELCMNCDVHGHILRSSYNLPVLNSYRFICDVHGEFVLIHVNLYDIFPAVSSGKVRENLGFFLSREW